MSQARLKSSLQAQAILRLYDLRMIPVYLRKRGDADAGALMIVTQSRAGAALYTQAYDLEGRRQWLRQGWMDAAEAEAKIARAVERDPDVWIIEIEDDQDRALFKEAL